ncbi:polyamine ABC transporter substrate-binding protein [Palleronia sp. LCG004]|uniref:polyamine ABC transporter substrate-binding protein n=1 Tax=Palleronia sp. LCG004 TaxID=3079304 RepID=UPI0029424F58|nr:polyamine ABC transporter substrate-binding protein [Palleronia sp. LCG004]WOI56276.1 polyamine ABC transporter substrate-binding protein [Palleronia sp. LCG004]
MTRTISTALLVLAAPLAAHAQDTLNFYNWSDYIAEDTIPNFESETGIDVNYDVFDSNEVVEARMLTGNTGYDLVVPSLEFMARQAQAGVFQEIDKERIGNYGNLDPEILRIVSGNDPDNTYGIPYMMYSVGPGYNVDMVTERLPDADLDSWSLIFDPENAAALEDCGIALLDSPSEIVGAALNYLELDPNSEDTADLDRAMELLQGIRPHIRYFHSSQYINDLANGDICLAVGYSGDILQAKDRASEAGNGVDIRYVIPAEGGQLGFDMMVIPADAPNPDAAYAFIDYFLQPQVTAAISDAVYYANANREATPLVSDEVREDPGIYPPEATLQKMFSAVPKSARYDRSLTRAWTSLKTGR